jgi:TRAP-type C4-dicarboxylate transport system substrate-binding protein
MGRIWLLALVCASSLARAQEPALRIATLAPDGTEWARELRSWAKNVESESKGAVGIKLYFGGLAGDEPEVFARIGRGQLDGAISGGHICERISPSLRVMKVPGLFRDRDEASFALRRLRARIDQEAKANGFTNLADGGIGSMIVFSRRPIRSFAELKQMTLWSGKNEMMSAWLGALGLHVTNEAIGDVAAQYAAGKIDGFLTTPSVALAWQWSSQARVYMDLRLAFLSSCLMVTNASFDALPIEAQRAVRTAVAKLAERSELLARQQEDALLGKVFPKQGLQRVPVGELLLGEFFAAARALRERIDSKIVPPELLRELLADLADYRAEQQRSR